MKIANIIQGTDLGGMEQASLRLMAGLQERGHSCEVVSLNPIGRLAPLLAEKDIPAIGLPYLGKWGWRSYFQLRRTLRLIQADALLMTGHNLLAMLALDDLCRDRRMLAVYFHHEGVKPLWQWRLIYRIACSRFRAIVFISDFIRQEAERIHPPIKSLSRTVPMPLPDRPLPTAEERRHARMAFGLPADARVIGNAGWLIPRKRFDIFLRTASLILRKVPDALFLVAGDGEERAGLEVLAKELNIASRVKWLGWQKNMSTFYSCLDVMLFNSDWDAVGVAPLEAISYGIPLVASVLHGGLQEILDRCDYGFLISVHDIEALAEKAVYFLHHPHEARQVAFAGRERIAQISNTRQIAAEIELLLN